ncbi:MAG: peptidase P60 [Rhizobiales bacterium 65-79]|jgi:NlpC/P60 family putative phage cell wall peptidase|nr:C40 family peptidase [Hyphomicrobiales bacterium]OJU04433.1 MAG: peptidase P60 [Rhizobiales bacterium 65-79]
MTSEDIIAPAASRIIAEARTWIGTPYRHQGSRKGVGCDCLGLVRGVWHGVYGEEPETPGPYAADWAEAGAEDRLLTAARRYCIEKDREDMAAGDLLLFRWRPNVPAKHAGIFVADERFIHAYQGHSVLVSALVPHWRRRIAGVFAFPELPVGR